MICLIEVEEEDDGSIGYIWVMGVHLTLFVWLTDIIGIHMVCLVEVEAEAEDIGSTDYISIADFIGFSDYIGFAHILVAFLVVVEEEDVEDIGYIGVQMIVLVKVIWFILSL